VVAQYVTMRQLQGVKGGTIYDRCIWHGIVVVDLCKVTKQSYSQQMNNSLCLL